MPHHRPLIQALRSLILSKPAQVSMALRSYVRPASRIRPASNSLRTPMLLLSFPGPQLRQLHTSTAFSKGITPDAEDPIPKEFPGERITQRTDVTDEQYHELSDRYLEGILTKLEEMQESREDLDVEFSVRSCGDTSCCNIHNHDC